MFDIQKTRRLHKICGLDYDGNIRTVPNLWCVRKHMEDKHSEWKKFSSLNKSDLFSFVSSPSMSFQQKTALDNIMSWCHPFREHTKFLKDSCSRYIMMPESDFLSEKLVVANEHKIAYDFFYLTLNSSSGKKHKGLDVFIRSLPVLCGRMNLKGLVVVYYPASATIKTLSNLNKEEKNILKRYSSYLKFHWGWQSQKKLSEIMTSCRFGFFPNEMDCSPRLLVECLLRDRPVVVNDRIWGGWHYVNECTGVFFDPNKEKSIASALQILSQYTLKPREYFISNFGFKKSAARLAEFLKPNYPHVKDFSHLYFNSYIEIMRNLI